MVNLMDTSGLCLATEAVNELTAENMPAVTAPLSSRLPTCEPARDMYIREGREGAPPEPPVWTHERLTAELMHYDFGPEDKSKMKEGW